jgi:uncharacterized membrane protein YdbT with pleckstrin-like domain
MRYVDESLAPGEEILARGRWPGLFWFGAWAALIVLGIAIVGIFIFVRSAVIMKTTDFAVTNKRIILKRGWLNRETRELAVQSVEGVSLDQSWWARLWNYGRVVVTGTGDAVIVFPPMADPVTFRRAIEAARAEGREMHLSSEDRDAIAHANDPAPKPEPEQPPRKRRSFIGLRN